jgi:hypothetical protein
MIHLRKIYTQFGILLWEMGGLLRFPTKKMKNVKIFEQPAMWLVAQAETKTERNACFLFDGVYRRYNLR